MAKIYKEFNEELGWIYVPKSIAQILIDVSTIDDVSRKVKILEFHVQALEEEMRRIDGFKRQFPHCIHFLEDASEIIKQEILRLNKNETCPIVEEFMPLETGVEGSSGLKESNDVGEKKEWMSTFQLWTTPLQSDNVLHQKSSFQGDQASGSGGKFKHKGEASMHFKKSTLKNKGVDLVSSSAADQSEVEVIDLNVTGKNPQLHERYPQPAPKKQRRCWSPVLHDQFVNALQQLGGVDSATPKQIRVMMNVEGLTNDEVKSHLQKYRLHLRKLPSLAQQLSHSWLVRDNQRGGVALVPVVANSGNSQSPNLHRAGGSVSRGCM